MVGVGGCRTGGHGGRPRGPAGPGGSGRGGSIPGRAPGIRGRNPAKVSGWNFIKFRGYMVGEIPLNIRAVGCFQVLGNCQKLR